MAAISASHSRAANSTKVSSTVCRSKVERLITLSTSALAVCCCSDSRSSPTRRVFSMAMTAWSANVVTASTCFAVNGCGTVLATKITPTTSPARMSGTPSAAR